MRRIAIYSTVLAIFGVILVSGTLYEVPYTVRELVRVDKSRTWMDDSFVLMPFENKNYWARTSVANSSIIQIEVNSSDVIIFKIIEDDGDEPWFEEGPRRGRTFYWTPPKSNVWQPAFYNPSSTQVNVTAKITEFFPKTTEYRDVIHYRSMLEPFEGYSGIAALIIAIGLNVLHISREAERQD